ncbi:hypothetical protein EHO61_02960 [Leptospira fluminis]|uniref:Adhesin domain-containing protein n=1 Tax=Leptospira fluminis TaxID=2484979 RepID=A0A4R9GS60_9LEPT|nr:hypothetical protein [Leptospira fluminis]TGK20843.1 hypothetical protein EHO61_02960 [Leptospira fluminis]
MKEKTLQIHPLDMSGVTCVEIFGHGGEVFVSSGNASPECMVEKIGNIKYRIEKKGEKLKITAVAPHFVSSGEIRFQLSLPENQSVKIAGNSTPIRLRGKFRDVDAACSEGDIRLETASGNFRLASAKGDIVLSNVQGSVSASTAGGDIIAGELSGDHLLTSVTGTLTLAGGEGRFRLSSEHFLSANEIRLRPGSQNYFVTGGPLRLKNLIPEGGCLLQASGPKNRIFRDLPSFLILEKGKYLKASAIGPKPSHLQLRSKEEIHIHSSRNEGPDPKLCANA